MPAIKPIDQASAKWAGRAAAASGDYATGVQNPKVPWSSAAQAGEAAYKDGVTKAANAGRYGKGVKAAGDEKWRKGATLKGPGRYAEGVNIGKDDWAKGFGPYHSAISSLVLPPRGAKGAAQNIQRVAVIATALRALKEKAGG